MVFLHQSWLRSWEKSYSSIFPITRQVLEHLDYNYRVTTCCFEHRDINKWIQYKKVYLLLAMIFLRSDLSYTSIRQSVILSSILLLLILLNLFDFLTLFLIVSQTRFMVTMSVLQTEFDNNFGRICRITILDIKISVKPVSHFDV